MKRSGLFVFGSVLYRYQNKLYYGDMAYQQTVELCRPFLGDIWVIARCREVTAPPKPQKTLPETGAELVMELPDYGMRGVSGWTNLASMFLSPSRLFRLNKLMGDSDLVFVEAPSFEGFLTAIVAKINSRKLTMETRGMVLINSQYMKARFGFLGSAWASLHQYLYKFVRSQSGSGLYVSCSLMNSYPVSGEHMSAISDVRLPETTGEYPRMYDRSAARFLFVGHLEKVKRIDVIIQSLALVGKQIDPEWSLQIVGTGPEQSRLRELAADLEVSEQISFHGRVPWGDELFNLYREADILLMASLSEGNSRVLIEAMSFALPVISTDVGEAPALLSGEALVPHQAGVTDYAEKLYSMASDPQELIENSKRNWQISRRFELSHLQAQRFAFIKKAAGYSDMI